MKKPYMKQINMKKPYMKQINMKKPYMKQIKNTEVLKSEFTFIGFLFSVALTYSGLILAEFILELFFFYYFPNYHHVYTDPEPAYTVLEAVENAKGETTEFITRRPIQLVVVSVILGIGTFIILYGPWEY